jgi:hypothetical protein
MEAVGRIYLTIEAKLFLGTSNPNFWQHGDNYRWNDVGVSVSSGNFLVGKVSQP